MKRLAMNSDGTLGWCSMPSGMEGQNGCPHKVHKSEEMTEENFINLVEKYNNQLPSLKNEQNQSRNQLQTRQKLLAGCALLDEKMREFGITNKTEFIICGGFVVSKYINSRTTADMDSMNKIPAPVKTLIPEVAREFDLAEDWLNDDIAYMPEKSENYLGIYSKIQEMSDSLDVAFDGELLSIRELPLEAQMLLKMEAIDGRTKERDASDFLGLASILNLDKEGFNSIAKEYYTDYTWGYYHSAILSVK